MSRTAVPEPWAAAMTTAGVVDPRTRRPSWRELGRRTGLHHSVLVRAAAGGRPASPRVVAAVAEALGLPAEVVRGWFGAPGSAYRPPAAARRLTAEERSAVDALILRLTSRHPD